MFAWITNGAWQLWDGDVWGAIGDLYSVHLGDYFMIVGYSIVYMLRWNDNLYSALFPSLLMHRPADAKHQHVVNLFKSCSITNSKFSHQIFM